MRALVPLLLAAALLTACGGKQTRNANAPAPTVQGATSVAGTKVPELNQVTAKFLTSCTAEGNGAKRQAFCRCVVAKLRASTTKHELLVVLQAGRTPPLSAQRKLRKANTACRAKLG